MYAGGNVLTLMQVAEFLIICGAAAGSLIVMSPKDVLIDMAKGIFSTLKGAPFTKTHYNDLFKALYELFLMGRRNGMTAVEEHISDPHASPLFQKYPSFLADERAVEFLVGALRPIVDGKVKPDQLKTILELELDTMEEEMHKPINVLTKTADAMPGFGIVAAVLGIVLTMSSISGDVGKVGEHVAAALVGTFLGILLSYGYLNPLAVNMEFQSLSRMSYYKCISTAVCGFATGMAPMMSVEMARRSLGEMVRPEANEMEQMLKQAVAAPTEKAPA